MANFTLTASATFKDGLSVGAYPVSNWPAQIEPTWTAPAAPLGSATNSQTMTAGTLTFTGLSSGVDYVAVADIGGGVYRYLRFKAGADFSSWQTLANTGGPGRELGYAEMVSDFVTTNTALTDAPGLTVAVPVGALPIMISLHVDTFKSTSALGGSIQVSQDGVDLGAISTTVNTTGFVPGDGERRLNPAAGSHTYKIQTFQAAAGTITLKANTGAGQNGPAFIRVNEVQL